MISAPIVPRLSLAEESFLFYLVNTPSNSIECDVSSQALNNIISLVNKLKPRGYSFFCKYKRSVNKTSIKLRKIPLDSILFDWNCVIPLSSPYVRGTYAKILRKLMKAKRGEYVSIESLEKSTKVHTIPVRIVEIRQAIGRSMIETKNGTGYRLTDQAFDLIKNTEFRTQLLTIDQVLNGVTELNQPKARSTDTTDDDTNGPWILARKADSRTDLVFPQPEQLSVEQLLQQLQQQMAQMDIALQQLRSQLQTK